jgi:hypothetical protein
VETGKKLARRRTAFDTLSSAEYDRWRKATEAVDKEWIGEVGAKGANGAALLDDAKALIKNTAADA